MSNWRSRDGDKVTEDVRHRVLARDVQCFIFRIDPGHVCADRWGRLHHPFETWRLSLDHVKDGPMLGKRAPSDEWHLVAMCYRGNIAVPSKEVRAAERTYLQSLREAATVQSDPTASL